MRDIYKLIPVSFAIACGPAGRPDSLASIDASPTTIDAPASNPVATDAAPVDSLACGQVAVTYRDFPSSHPDMQSGVGVDPGIVRPLLDANSKPVYQPSGSTLTVAGASSFDQWYRDVPGVNMTSTSVLSLVEGPPGTFTYDNQSYFPLDNLALGNEGNPHNYHFTSEIHTTFTYHGGETFQFTGDDDVFVFVNKRLAIDLGGVHDPMSQAIDFDARAAELGIVPGNTYQLDVFHAERHTVASTFRMTSTIECLVVL